MKRILLALALTLALALPAAAGELAGVTLADTARVGDQSLVLNGMALRKVAIIKVYVAGLYLSARESDGAKVLAADTPRHMVMKFLRGVGKDDLCEGWYDGLEANNPDAPAAVRAQFDTLCSWMEDVEKGSGFAFTYRPGEGTTVTVNGKVKGTIEGKAFADSLFAAWIGPNPGPGEKFKRDLLGG